jgi:hypothetical protein
MPSRSFPNLLSSRPLLVVSWKRTVAKRTYTKVEEKRDQQQL